MNTKFTFKKLILLPIFFFGIVIFLISCKDDDEVAPVVGTLKGLITDASTTDALAEATITVFNANDNSPVSSILTGIDGNFTIELPEGNYFIKVSKQGYISVPAPSLSAVPFSIVIGQTTERNVSMFASNDSDIGFISGKITSGGTGVAGALVIGENGVSAFSGVSDKDGNYKIFNVKSGTYSVSGWLGGYNSDQVQASVSQGTETTDINILLTGNAAGTLSGQVKNIAAGNIDVDVALVHPITRETIPGLTGKTVTQLYTLTNIPDGTYIARATFENDDRVMDPDRIFKFGEPEVTIAGSSETIDFDITLSISLIEPNNEASTTAPVEIKATTPSFVWTPYSSTSDYVIEVTDATSGVIIWGGFDQSGAQPVKNIVIPSSQTSIAFNEDGNASVAQLEVGKVYRWRVFASKNDQNSPTGWTLISASEDQRGLIKIVE
jgi:hypothetical protein